MQQQQQQFFEVSADWMRACGFGEEARVFPVLRVYKRGGLNFADLDAPNFSDSKPWPVITNWRGRFVPTPDSKEI